jgi:hypothetical protein
LTAAQAGISATLLELLDHVLHGSVTWRFFRRILRVGFR